MTDTTLRVELGLDLGNASPIGLKLDDATQGKLDSVYVLGGELFYDVADRIQNFSSQRGKNNTLDRIDSGQVTFELDNSDRLFDPLYTEGLYYGSLIPRRKVRTYVNDTEVFFGSIDDFDIAYYPGNRSTTMVSCSDDLSVLAAAELSAFTPTEQTTGARVSAILDRTEVAWPATARSIQTGDTTASATPVAANTSALEYLQLVNQGEQGELFIGKNGDLTFVERSTSASQPDLVFSDDSTTVATYVIPYTYIGNEYGSENLYNQITVTAADGVTTVTVNDTISQNLYGIRPLEITGLLLATSDELTTLASLLLAKYKQPIYRFSSVKVNALKLDATNLQACLDLEIGNIVTVQFTPSGIPPTVIAGCKIIGISHDKSPIDHTITFSLETIESGVFILDSSISGKLDTNTLA